MKSTQEKVSYCVGLETAKNLIMQFGNIDVDLLQKGFCDGVASAQPQLSQEEIQSSMLWLRHEIEKQKQDYFNYLSEKNLNEGETFLSQNKKKEGVKILQSGLQYQILASGSGAKPTEANRVLVHYQGSFIDGTIFDTTFKQNTPQSFPVSRVMPGWAEALQLMQVGDRWQIVVPHHLAYGQEGSGTKIGPNMTLVFELELLAIDP